MQNLKTLKPFFVGFLLGILVLGSGAALFAKSYVDGAKTDYSDEVTKLSTVAEEAKEPLLQKDYVITGLILSDKFNEFLEEGVQEGLWTEDFLIQFGGDYSIPILLKNYADVIGAIATTDKAKAVAKTISKVADVVTKIKLQLELVGPKLQGLIETLKDPDLKDEALAKIKEILFNVLQNAGVTALIANVLNKLGVFKFKVKDTINSFKRVLSKVKVSLSKLKGLIAQLKDPELKARALAQIKEMVFNLLHNMGITAMIANLLNKLEVFKFKVRDSIGSFKRVIANVKSLIAKLKDPALKDKVLAQVKAKLFTVLQNAGITAMIANVLNKIDVLKFKVKDTLESFKQVISALKDPALKAKVVAKVKALINAKLASLGIKAKLDQIIAKINTLINTLINKVKNFDLAELKANLTAQVKALLSGKLGDVKAIITQKINDIVAAIKAKLNPAALEAMLMAFIASNSDVIKAKVSQVLAANQDKIKEAIINAIAANIDLSAIQIAIDNINNIIDRLQKLEEQMPEIKGQIEAIIDSFNNLISILNNIDVNGIESTIDAVVEQIDAIFAQIDAIAGVLGDASSVIGAIMSQEDTDKDDWNFIPALKAYDNSLKIVNLPKSLYTKLNVLEPVLNVLTLDIDYTFTPDDGNIINGNKAKLVINHVNVGKESSTNSRDVIGAPIEFGGVIADTVNGFLPVLNNNI